MDTIDLKKLPDEAWIAVYLIAAVILALLVYIGFQDAQFNAIRMAYDFYFRP